MPEAKHKRPPTISRIRFIDLQESVGVGRGAQTIVSVLDPVIRIERTHDKDNQSDDYRIILTFKLQIKIHAFEKGYLKKYQKLFDSVSLRYLYHDGEKHQVKPTGDKIARFKSTDETTNSKSVDVNLSADLLTGAVTPSIGVHVQRDNKLTYERENERSWRRGLSFESYSRSKPAREFTWKGTGPVDSLYHHHSFQAHSGHNRGCKCDKTQDNLKALCRYRYPTDSSRPYDHCAHWFWQTVASAHLWTPEIYESFITPITVTRVISTKSIEHVKDSAKLEDKLRHLLHFDFVVSTRLRELGWRFKDHFTFRHQSKPAEARAKKDFGYPIPADRVTFCVWCCPARSIKLPEHPTRNLQKEADDEVAKHGSAVRHLKNSDEFFKDASKEHEKSRKTKEKELLEKKEKEILEKFEKTMEEKDRKFRLEKLERDAEETKSRKFRESKYDEIHRHENRNHLPSNRHRGYCDCRYHYESNLSDDDSDHLHRHLHRGASSPSRRMTDYLREAEERNLKQTKEFKEQVEKLQSEIGKLEEKNREKEKAESDSEASEVLSDGKCPRVFKPGKGLDPDTSDGQDSSEEENNVIPEQHHRHRDYVKQSKTRTHLPSLLARSHSVGKHESRSHPRHHNHRHRKHI